MTDLNNVARVYDLGSDREYERLKKTPVHESEFELTVDLLLQYIVPGSSVLDVGAGPGRYSQFLIEGLGCKVGLVDLSEVSLDAFNRRIDSKYQKNVLFTKIASATEMDWIEPSSFDSVLLMGPLYHLLDEDERRVAVEHSFRILKTGGHVFASFLSPYVKLVALLDNEAAALTNQAGLDRLLNQGIAQNTFADLTLDWYHCWPTQASQLMEKVGFQKIRIRNLQGIGSVLGDAERQTLNDPALKKAWLTVLRRTCEIPDLLEATIHFLYIGRKP